MAADASAHGFGQRFDLPLPLWLWVTGAAATIVLTFVALAVFAGPRRFDALERSVDLLRLPAVRRLAHPLAVALRAAACVVFVLGLAAGLVGTPDAYRNLLVTLVWVAWWVGMAFFSALVGNLWEVADPLPTLYRIAASRLGRGRDSLGLRYPERLGAWPAVVLFFGFAWIELLWPGKDVPRLLAGAVPAYAAIAWTGMLLFGVDAWRQRGDAFAMAFRVLGRFAPLEVRGASRGAPARLRLRAYGAGLLSPAQQRVPASVAVFVLLMLSTVTFDGFHETPLMERLETEAQAWRPVAEGLFALSEHGLDETTVLRSAAMLLFPCAFVLAFAAVGGLMLRGASPFGTRDDALAMVWSVDITVSTSASFAEFLRAEVRKYESLATRTGLRLP